MARDWIGYERKIENLRAEIFKRGYDKKKCKKQEKILTDFFDIISEIQEGCCESIFSVIVKERTLQIENIAEKNGILFGNIREKFESKEAKKIVKKDLSNLPDIYAQIEAVSLSFFENILLCWTEFEIFKYTSKAKSKIEELIDKQKKSISYRNETVSEIVDDISKDTRLFRIEEIDFPTNLSNAIVLINLFQLVKEKKWFEMLFSIELSTKGRHFIYYKVEDIDINNYPKVIASALILSVEEKENWLTFSDFFQNENWKALCTKQDLVRFLEGNDFKINLDMMSDKFNNVKDFENQFLRATYNPKELCEVMRLAVDSKVSFRSLPAIIKGLIKKQSEKNIKISFVVSEKMPVLAIMEAMESCFNICLFVLTSEYNIVNSESKVYKSLYSPTKALASTNQVSDKILFKKMITQKKQRRKKQ